MAVFNNKDYAAKFSACKYKTEGYCEINRVWIEGDLAMIAHCGNCLANTKSPNLF